MIVTFEVLNVDVVLRGAADTILQCCLYLTYRA